MGVTPITSSRQFRKGRILHSVGNDFALCESPEPRVWVGIQITPSGVTIKRIGTIALRSRYVSYSNSIRAVPSIDRKHVKVLEDELRDKWSATMPFAVKNALMRASTSLAYSPPTPASIEEMLKSPISSPDFLDKMKFEPPVAPITKPASRKRASSFSVPPLPEDSYWYESDADRKLTRDYISLRKAGFTVNLMIAGPSGSGKTVGVERLGKELGIPVHIVNCQAITTPEKWIGQMMADPEKGTYFVPSQHVQWVEGTAPECLESESCILLYDEITRLRPELNNMTYSLFDTQRGLEVPQMGRRVLMNPKNLIIATANIGSAFSGTFGQDRAFRERFAMTMERDFPPVEEEVKILTSATGITAEDATSLARVAHATRNMWREQTIEQPISTRTLVTWSLLVSGGYDIMQAAEYTVLPLYSEDGGVESDRAKVRLQIEGKVA